MNPLTLLQNARWYLYASKLDRNFGGYLQAQEILRKAALQLINWPPRNV